MNANYRRVPAAFGPETRFEVNLVAGKLRGEYEERFEGLKDRLVAERLEEVWEPALGGEVRRAAAEAAALAWVTPYPLLVFPVLFDEKTEAALRRAARQEQVFQRSRELLCV